MIVHILEAWLNGLATILTDLMTLGAILLSTVWKHLPKSFTSKFDLGKQILNDLKDFANRIYQRLAPDPEGFQEAWDHAQEALKSVEQQLANVFTPTGNTVQGALADGGIPAQTDGGLGQTHDNFTPQGEVPFNVGTMPGMGTDAVGPSHGSGGNGGNGGNVGYGGGGYGGGNPGGAVPIGGSSGAGTGTPPGGGGANPGNGGVSTMPTASDLGLDPGTYFEYQPTLNQVQITYPDGSTETRPWPPQ